MQSSSRSRPFKSGLIGASPIPDARVAQRKLLSRCKSSARLSAKEKVRGANPRESTSFGRESRVECREPEDVAILLSTLDYFHVGYDVRAASRPVTAPVRVRVPLANPIYDGPKLVGYPPP